MDGTRALLVEEDEMKVVYSVSVVGDGYVCARVEQTFTVNVGFAITSTSSLVVRLVRFQIPYSGPPGTMVANVSYRIIS